MMSGPGRPARNWPISFSLRPSPYTSAVSRKVTPDATAASSTASASFSSMSPQSAPSCQVPSPITEMARPVRPSIRLSTDPDPNAGGLGHGVGAGRGRGGGGYGGLQPAADAVQQGQLGAGLGVTEAGLDPQLPGLAGGRVELLGVVDREELVLVAVHDEQR